MNWFSTLRIFLAHGGRDFLRHKTLSLLNLLALAVGVAAIVAIQTVNETALRSFRASLDSSPGVPISPSRDKAFGFRKLSSPCSGRTLPSVK